MATEKMAAEIADKFAQKMELIAKVKELQAEMAKLNVDLARAGAAADQVACW